MLNDGQGDLDPASSAAGVPDDIEKCVVCHQPTDFRRTDPIASRFGYVDGTGQLCKRCAVRLDFVSALEDES